MASVCPTFQSVPHFNLLMPAHWPSQLCQGRAAQRGPLFRAHRMIREEDDDAKKLPTPRLDTPGRSSHDGLGLPVWTSGRHADPYIHSPAFLDQKVPSSLNHGGGCGEQMPRYTHSSGNLLADAAERQPLNASSNSFRPSYSNEFLEVSPNAVTEGLRTCKRSTGKQRTRTCPRASEFTLCRPRLLVGFMFVLGLQNGDFLPPLARSLPRTYSQEYREPVRFCSGAMSMYLFLIVKRQSWSVRFDFSSCSSRFHRSYPYSPLSLSAFFPLGLLASMRGSVPRCTFPRGGDGACICDTAIFK
jgi:hypothetical protein